MQTKKLIVIVAVVCAAGYSYAAPARRVTAVDRILALRAKYNPFTMNRTAAPTPAPAPAPAPAARVPVTTPAAPARVAATPAPAPVIVRVAGTAVRPPYRPSTRSPYQPPTRGPYIAARGR